MKEYLYFLLWTFLFSASVSGQNSFNFSVALEPVNIPNLPGIHSYAYGQHDGKWLIIGGRRDGIHARQPFNAFPSSQNNTSIFVIDLNTEQFWSSSVEVLPAGIREQLQSSNMNFYQDNDTLFIIGGYAFSPSANDHITFPNLTSVQVSTLIDAIINGGPITSYFKQITDDIFAVTGGQLGKIENTFYLVGGQRFDGRYNPMGHPTYTQTYTNQIQKFTIDNSGSQLSFSNYSAITDPIHLRRRDYNLLPQIFPDGTQGYTISSGVFQINEDLPFLYPVDISDSGYTPITGFNQYLSNYHSAKVCLFDSTSNEMHSLFFGGMSQYYYQSGNLIQDNQVPFVKTISRLTRFSDGTLQEFQLPIEMPGLKGASAEFIPNRDLPHYSSEVIKLSEITQDTILIGHIYGGILSPALNPFSVNQTGSTSADNTIYTVKLIHQSTLDIQEINGKNPYILKVYPNPTTIEFTIEYSAENPTKTHYFLTSVNGQIIKQGVFNSPQSGLNKHTIDIEDIPAQTLFVTVVIDNKFYLTEKLLKK